MKGKLNIESLIEKFNQGTISHDELAVLIEYFRENNPSGELMSVYQHAWENAASEHSEINSAQLYSQVISRIDTDVEEEKPARILANIWRYAAIFIVAFAISWFINNQTTNDKPASITYQNIEVPYGSKTKVQLPDGSYVTLNSGSKLKYANGFGDNSRTVFLEGEAFFDVNKNKAMPFYVNVSGIKIKVLGTTFNVKAYPEEKTVETTLITGSVQIYKADNETETTPMATLQPSEMAVYEKKSGELKKSDSDVAKVAEEIASVPEKEIEVQQNINTELSTAWKNNELVFNNERFEDLTKRIERWYNVEIELNHPGLKEARFSGKFDKETLEQAIKALTLVTPFQYKIEKNHIWIYK